MTLQARAFRLPYRVTDDASAPVGELPDRLDGVALLRVVGPVIERPPEASRVLRSKCLSSCFQNATQMHPWARFRRSQPHLGACSCSTASVSRRISDPPWHWGVLSAGRCLALSPGSVGPGVRPRPPHPYCRSGSRSKPPRGALHGVLDRARSPQHLTRCLGTRWGRRCSPARAFRRAS